MDLTAFFLNIFSAALIAVITAVVTVRLSLKRFYSEKWWEKRWVAYTTILECLHHMNRSFSEDWNAEVEGRKISEKRKIEFQRKSTQSYDELLKQIDVGQFILTSDALTELKDFQKEYNKSFGPNWLDYLEGNMAALEKVQKNFSEIAKKDLEFKTL